MKRLTNRKPYFDKEGNLFIPDNIKFPGDIEPKINTKEWFYIIFEMTDKSDLSEEKKKRLRNGLFGSRSTQYRIKKSLKDKKFL